MLCWEAYCQRKKNRKGKILNKQKGWFYAPFIKTKQMDNIVARIEKDLITERFKYLMTLPSPLRLQLKRIEDKVFKLWKLDTVYVGQIRIDCFDACANSRLTLNQLEDVILKEGEKLTKYPFDKALKKIVRSANRANRKSAFKTIGKLINGKAS